MAFKFYQTRPNTIKYGQTRLNSSKQGVQTVTKQCLMVFGRQTFFVCCPGPWKCLATHFNTSMFGHQRKFDGVWSPSLLVCPGPYITTQPSTSQLCICSEVLSRSLPSDRCECLTVTVTNIQKEVLKNSIVVSTATDIAHAASHLSFSQQKLRRPKRLRHSWIKF